MHIGYQELFLIALVLLPLVGLAVLVAVGYVIYHALNNSKKPKKIAFLWSAGPKQRICASMRLTDWRDIMVRKER